MLSFMHTASCHHHTWNTLRGSGVHPQSDPGANRPSAALVGIHQPRVIGAHDAVAEATKTQYVSAVFLELSTIAVESVLV